MDYSVSTQHELDAKQIRKDFPEGPGVYQFVDKAEKVIYIGKAKNLKNRVLSYFRSPSELGYKTATMIARAKKVEHFITGTEKEALILERNLIKKYMPRYNVILRDDKQYPCLRLDVKEDFPRLSIVRKMKKDGARYFGPYASAGSVRRTVKLIDQVFHLRKCRSVKIPNRSRPCLNFQLGRCLGVCNRPVSKDDYHDVVRQVQLFLEGRNRELLQHLKMLMEKASMDLRFEEAAKLRDQIRSVESILERQRVVSARLEDEDVVGLAQVDAQFLIVILFIRKGALFENRNFLIKDEGADPSEVMEAFLKQYYAKDAFIPSRIYVSEPVEDYLSISEWLSDLSGKRVRIRHPKRGEKRRLTKMAVENAEHQLAQRKGKEDGELAIIIQRIFDMERPPLLVEGLDISTLHGDQAVGAVVSFKDGIPDKGGYRNYRIKSKKRNDDYNMMREMISRRLRQGNFPDLFVVDGGKGHLRVVEKAVHGVEGGRLIALAAIAKGDKHGDGDKIYVPGRKNPLSLKAGHPALNFFMLIRDEAHRRAVSYHRKLRRKALTDSELDLIPGIGQKRKQALLGRFGSLEGLKKSTFEEIAATPEISFTLARRIADSFGITQQPGLDRGEAPVIKASLKLGSSSVELKSR